MNGVDDDNDDDRKVMVKGESTIRIANNLLAHP